MSITDNQRARRKIGLQKDFKASSIYSIYSLLFTRPMTYLFNWKVCACLCKPKSLALAPSVSTASSIMENKNATMKKAKIKLSKMKTDDEKLAFLLEGMMGLGPPPAKPGGPEVVTTDVPPFFIDIPSREAGQDMSSMVSALAAEHNLSSQFEEGFNARMLNGTFRDHHPWAVPITSVPCANHEPSLYERCPEVGTRACSGCRLVLYCSQVCVNFTGKASFSSSFYSRLVKNLIGTVTRKVDISHRHLH